MVKETDHGELARNILSDVILHMKYAQYRSDLQRRENWREAVDRRKAMDLKKFPQLRAEIEWAYSFVYAKMVLPSMRSMQFGGRAAEINNARMYNCSFQAMDHYLSFSELMFLLLCGCGCGYSVQKAHVNKLPEIRKPTKKRRYLIPDSIEGWADAVKMLMKAYMQNKALPVFDFSDIRPKGTRLKTSGGRAPGPEPLKDCLHNIQKILDRKQDGEKLTPIEVHDICCYIADAVLSGGIRRSSLIALFDMDDEDMLAAKTGNWYETHPFRQNANNSAVILRHRIQEDEFFDLWHKITVSGSGEPGIFFTNDKDWGLNPCAEISLRPNQFCNLATINAGNLESEEDFFERCRAAAFIATLQASYTDFHYLRDVWKRTTEKEALIGISMTGIATGTVLNYDMKKGAQIVKETNAGVAEQIGINKAARATTIKPEGTGSLFLGTSSGIHGWHDKFYLRSIRVNKTEAIYTYLSIFAPELLEDDLFKPSTMAIIRVPQKAPEGAITRSETALELLARVSKVWREWVSPGHRSGANRNNVSTTISVRPNEWEEVGRWMWENRNSFTALSVLPFSDHVYAQAPFESITEEEYEKRLAQLTEIDLDKVIEIDDNTSLQDNAACVAGGCEVF